MTIKWLAASLGCVTFFTAHAQLRVRPRFPVGTAQVARTIATAFANRGIQISADQVMLPVDVLAAVEDPLLEVSAIQQLGQLSMSHPEQASAGVKLRCKTTGACLPFYAVVTWEKLTRATAVSEVHSAASAAKLLNVVAAGAHVTLLLEADHTSIRMDAISLENAAPGRPVRVTSPDRKHVYQAVVVDAALVKGRF